MTSNDLQAALIPLAEKAGYEVVQYPAWRSYETGIAEPKSEVVEDDNRYLLWFYKQPDEDWWLAKEFPAEKGTLTDVDVEQ